MEASGWLFTATGLNQCHAQESDVYPCDFPLGTPLGDEQRLAAAAGELGRDRHDQHRIRVTDVGPRALPVTVAVGHFACSRAEGGAEDRS
jgi:hypothetical protein